MSGDTASRVGWGVVLGGEEYDLEEWREALKQPFDPWVTEDGLILRSSSLDRATTGSEAYDLAKEEMDQINGALAVRRRARVVQLEGIVEILSNGSRRRAPVLASKRNRKTGQTAQWPSLVSQTLRRRPSPATLNGGCRSRQKTSCSMTR
jgi:hypothetical protein